MARADRFATAFRVFAPKPAARLAEHLRPPDEAGLYFVGGGDGWLRQQSLRRIAEHHLGPRPMPYRRRLLHAGSATADRFRSAAQTVSFGGGPVVVLGGLRATARRASRPELFEAVAEVVESPPRGAVIAVEWEETPDRRRKGWKAFSGGLAARVSAGEALVVDCDPPEEREMPAWVRAEARERGLELPPGGAELFAGRFGRDLRRQRNEIEKLALYVAEAEAPAGESGEGEGPSRRAGNDESEEENGRGDDRRGGDGPGNEARRIEVSLEEMEQVLGGGSARNLFRFTNAVQGRRTAEALDLLDHLLREGESPQALLALLYRLATQMQVANAFRPGRAAGSLKEALGLSPQAPPRVAEEIAAAAARFSAGELRGVLRTVIETDFRMKSTGLPDRVALSSLAFLLGRRAPSRAPSGTASGTA